MFKKNCMYRIAEVLLFVRFVGSEMSPGGVNTGREVVGLPPQKCFKHHKIIAKWIKFGLFSPGT